MLHLLVLSLPAPLAQGSKSISKRELLQQSNKQLQKPAVQSSLLMKHCILLLWTFVDKLGFCFEYLFSVLWGTYVEVELLNHREILCLPYWGLTNLFLASSAPFPIPTSIDESSTFSTCLWKLLIFHVVVVVTVAVSALLAGIKCISLWFWFACQWLLVLSIFPCASWLL